MSHTREHGHIGYKLVFSIFLNLLITVVQLLGGVFAGSLSLLSDALHNFIDTFSLVTSYIAHRLSVLDHTPQKTFGYKRAEILVALFNAGFLIIVSFFLFKEATTRLLEPVFINSELVFVIALVGLIANSLCALLLKTHVHGNINVRSAFFHLLADALVSLAVIGGAVVIYFWEIFWVDSILTMFIGIYIIREGYKIVKDALNILMHHVPENIDLIEMQSDVENFPGVRDLHHVHVWEVTEDNIHMEGHINITENFKVREIQRLRDKIENLLAEKYSINHPTLQFECNKCSDVPLVKNRPAK